MRPRLQTDEQILAVARACILEHGPAVSTAHIAAELGLSQATLFKRFGTKEELLVRALLPTGDDELVRLLDTGPSEQPLPEQLEVVGAALLSLFDTVLPCVMMLRASNEGAAQAALRDPTRGPIRLNRSLEAWFQRAIDRGLARATRPGVAAAAFVGAVRNRVFTTHLMGTPRDPADDQAFLAGLSRLLFFGISPAPEPR